MWSVSWLHLFKWWCGSFFGSFDWNALQAVTLHVQPVPLNDWSACYFLTKTNIPMNSFSSFLPFGPVFSSPFPVMWSLDGTWRLSQWKFEKIKVFQPTFFFLCVLLHSLKIIWHSEGRGANGEQLFLVTWNTWGANIFSKREFLLGHPPNNIATALCKTWGFSANLVMSRLTIELFRCERPPVMICL